MYSNPSNSNTDPDYDLPSQDFDIESKKESHAAIGLLGSKSHLQDNINIEKHAKHYESKNENINVIPNDKQLRSSIDSDEQLDRILSGESLYKTFTFEQSPNDEDVEKCIAFWKSVMQKNLEPIKCSIVESSKTKPPPEEEKRESLSAFQEKLIKEAQEKVHEYYRDLWSKAMKESQKRKLNQVKLLCKSRCKMCDSQILKEEDMAEGYNSKEEIVGLNEWQPAPRKRGAPRKPSIPKKSSVEKETEEPTRKTDVCICAPVAETLSAASVETIIDERGFIPRDSTRYQLINMIDEKKRTGAYSRWRRSLVKPCTCGVPYCDCNINPAIQSITEKPITCGCGQLDCNCKIEAKQGNAMLNEKLSEASIAAESSEDVEHLCLCGHRFCICRNMVSAVTLKSDEGKPEIVIEEQSVGSVDTILGRDSDNVLTVHLPSPVKRTSKAGSINCLGGGDQESVSTIGSSANYVARECLCKKDKECSKQLENKIKHQPKAHGK